jgi:hypothetical protein
MTLYPRQPLLAGNPYSAPGFFPGEFPLRVAPNSCQFGAVRRAELGQFSSNLGFLFSRDGDARVLRIFLISHAAAMGNTPFLCGASGSLEAPIFWPNTAI